MAIREVGVGITADASQFKKEMSAVNRNLSGLKAEMSAVTAEFAENANSADALTRKQQVLDDQVTASKAKVDLLTSAYAAQVAATGETSAQAAKLRKQLNYAAADYAKATAAAKANKQELQAHGPIYARVGDSVSKLGKKISDWATDVINGAKSLPVLGDALKGVELAGEGVASGLKLAGKAIGATAEVSAKLVAGATAAGTALAALGVSGVSAMASFATDAAGRAGETMAQIQDLEKQAAEAEAKWDMQTAKKLREQIAELTGQLDTRFSTLAQNLTSLDSASQAAKDALGGLLLPVLENLSGEGAALLQGFAADLEACGGSTEKMGQVVSKYLKEAVQLIRKELPGMVSLGSDLIQALLEGLGDAGPEILSAAGEILDMLLDGLEQNADSLGDGASQLIMSLLQSILEASPQLLTAGITILTNLITGITNNLPTLIPAAVQAVQQLLQALVQNAPQLLIAGATMIKTLVEGLIDHVPDLLAAIPGMIQEFVDGFNNATLSNLTKVGLRIVNKILEGLKAAWSAVTDWISGAVDDIGNFLGIGGGGSGHAGGLNYVPYDNYPAILHRGERVLTAAENASGDYGRGGGTVVNNTFNVKSMTRAEMDYWIRRTDEDLGRAV